MGELSPFKHIDKISDKKYTVILYREDDEYYLAALQGDKLLPFSWLVTKFKLLNVFNTLLEPCGDQLLVPAAKLRKVRQYLSMFSSGLLGDSIEMIVAADIEEEFSENKPLNRAAEPKIKGRSGTTEIMVDDMAGEPASAPIPLRAMNSIPVKKDTNKEFIRLQDMGYNVKRGYLSSAAHFVEEAWKLEEYYEGSGEHVPFTAYMPTYDMLSPAQRRWYFYWRSRAREKEYLKTDLAYILLHIYELINGVGVQNEADAYEQLRGIWENYRRVYFKLDGYLVSWLMDFMIINKYPTSDLIELISYALDRNMAQFSYDLLLHLYLKEPFEKIPLDVFYKLSGYNYEKSKFYTGNKELEDKYVRSAFAEVNSYYKENFGMGIFEYYKPPEIHTIRRMPFLGAIYEDKVKNSITLEYPRYSRCKLLSEFFTSVIKHVENKLRELNKFSGRLRGYSLDPEVREVIDRHVSGYSTMGLAAGEVSRVKIDTDRVRELLQDSDEVRDRLLEGIEEADELEKPLDHEYASESNTTGDLPVQSNNPPANTAKLDCEGLPEEWSQFAELLEPIHVETLEVLAGQENVETGLNDICEKYMTMPEMLIDMVNGLALDTVGDILIDTGAGSPEIMDEYKETISKLLSR